MVRIITGGWDDWLSAFDAELTVAAMSAGGRRLRVYHVRRFANDHAEVSPANVTREQIIEWLSGHDWAPETRRSYRASLRRFYAWARSTGRMGHDPTVTLPAIRPPRALPRPAPAEAIAAGIAEADERTRLIIDLIASTGIRRCECAAIHSRDVVRDLCGWSLRVRGKGGHDRIVPVPAHLASAIRAAGGFLFPGQINGHLSARRVGELVSAAMPEGWTAHTIRHAYATAAYAASHDLRAVQELLGHAKPETTAIYTKVDTTRLREVAGRVWAA
ncbi:integrase [Gordonia phage Coeur]|uniref:Integrase n=1 Tax=Gordonia phage Coeur TaxID=2571246 RepID=A0A4Y6EH58_9CAUD|nr:integrase [Gordonia phage Coeur]QDF17437.1 integrase [Gordonia phage Coeur]